MRVPSSPLSSSKRTDLARIAAIIFLLLAAAFALAASSEPWKSKDYQSWTQDDVLRVLTESPWVKMVTVPAPWLKDGQGTMHVAAIGPAVCDKRTNMIHAMGPAMVALHNNSDPVDLFQVTWGSARTIRAAKLREAQLCGPAPAPRAESQLQDLQEDYVITVMAADMTPFAGMDEDALIKATSLWPKKSARAYSPKSVAILGNSADGDTHTLVFRFPRKTETGDALIASDEKEAEFTCQAGKVRVKAKFQVQKMVSGNGQDL